MIKNKKKDNKFAQLLIKWKRKLFSRPKLIRFLVVIAILGLASGGLYSRWGNSFNLPYLFNQTKSAVMRFADPTSALAQTNGRTNILIMGIGGAAHEAADLTDAMILASINIQNSDIVLLSLPRDIWIPSLRAKLNSAYYYGNQQQAENGGFILVKSSVSEITDLPVHYAVLLDFDGFKEIIDILGGINLEVKNEFDDYKYPIPGKENAEPESDRYEHLHFDAGWQYMDGETALKYVRSRNAEGVEGTDLARSERQKKVLLAIKDRLLNTKVLFNQQKLKELKSAIGESFKTDIADQLYPAFARLALEFQSARLESANLPIYLETDNGNTASESALLIHPPVSKQYDHQWVLEPKTGDFKQTHKYINCLLENKEEDCVISSE